MIFLILIIILNLFNLTLSGFDYNTKPKSLGSRSDCKAVSWKNDN
jgi:hypothetical protein